MNDLRNCSYLNPLQAVTLAAKLNAEDDSGWTYTAKPVAMNDFTLKFVCQYHIIEVRDDTGTLLGNL